MAWKTAATAASASAAAAAAAGVRPRSVLREVFDAPVDGSAASPLLRADARGSHTGLFGYEGLGRPEGFIEAARDSIRHAQVLVQRICEAEADADVRLTVRRLDLLSDVLCAVVDTAELIRNVHPDRAFVEAANIAHSAINNFLNQLNTHQGLYQALRRTLDRPHIADAMSEEERRVAQLLAIDFEKSGIHMPAEARKRFVDLNDRILELGQEFTLNAFPSTQSLSFTDADNELMGVPAQAIEAMSRQSSSSSRKRGGRGSTLGSVTAAAAAAATGKRAELPMSTDLASIVLRSARSEETRRRVFLAMNSGTEAQIAVLEEMLKKRGELARLLEKESYGHMFLTDKMAGSPENVWSFLETLAQVNRPLADAEFERINAIKRVHTGKPDHANAWDRAYYTQFLTPRPADLFSVSASAAATPSAHDPMHQPRLTNTSFEALVSYFTVGSTFQGLSDVFTRLYGIRLEPASVIPGETWHPDVRKLHVVHETEGQLGTIYCDLFRRESGGSRKYESAAHFTVRCSRLMDDAADEGSDAANPAMRNPRNEKHVGAPGGRTRRYQMPIVVLVTSFARPQAGKPGLLHMQDIETLFHEMGHAMHSMLARTDFQHIAGTRVAMDFVEVPSIMMEYFARSPEVLASFGQHYRTGEPVPIDPLRTQRSNPATLEALETQQQLQMAMLDQLYHSPLALDAATFDTTRILQQLQDRINPVRFAPGSHWQVQFSHLFGYGASYYSYFWSRRWASRIFRRLFADRGMAEWREGGEEVRRQVLAWGGGRDPWVGLQRIGVVRDGEREGRGLGELQDLQ
ncbi:Mitochondrial intermediate peptidase [Polyrhizophydium stewartii]|uniref:mitochondrial intermediate peptidase n=1 Tax=Polyrhizophydium stewartii TaxID=2732419 RepID=A0ABR4NH26_9FUNG|nr:Mitochondrial intermediate peptidase [Polyrhizophydium stewartii]